MGPGPPVSGGNVGPVTAAAIELLQITKRFPGVIANDRIDLAVQEGEIHAVVGENGAGKSTLMKILYGMILPDEGEIRIRGQATTMSSAKDAIAAGIGMVHQHFMLAEQMTVLENVILGAEPRSRLKVDFGEAKRRIAEISREGALDPDQLVEELSVGEKQRVEITKVLFRGAQILILDEPTAVLVPQEVEELFRSLRELRERGVTILFISHKLDEVLEIADRITVIRAGRTVATVDSHQTSTRMLAELMVGAELPTPDIRESTVMSEVLLEAEGLGSRSEEGDRWVIEDVSFRIRRGEVLGIAGVEGNGQGELVEVLIGIRAAHAGQVALSGKNLSALSTLQRREAGIGLIPADRHGRGLLLESPLWENTMLGHQSRPPFTRGLLVDRNGARRRTKKVVEAFDVRTPGVDVKIHALSGGNQQKLLVGKEMLATPQVLLASHPTRGIDVGAQAAVWESIRTARSNGLGVLLISADLDELIGLSDTLMVILRGRLVATLDPRSITPAQLGSYMTGAAL
ncbi:MAG: ABC transporter ATP-binding protein [Actinomycetia bacterium]|nr:ABC transporter ATP-binding protein [Actinomycetes bacterium]